MGWTARIGLAAALVAFAACGPATPPSPPPTTASAPAARVSPSPTEAARTPTAGAPTPTLGAYPPGSPPDRLATVRDTLIPAEFRQTCVLDGTTYSFWMMTCDHRDWYLTFTASTSAADFSDIFTNGPPGLTEFCSEGGVGEVVQGPWSVGAVAMGTMWICTDQAQNQGISFTIDSLWVDGQLDAGAYDNADVQAAFKRIRPVGSLAGAITSVALKPIANVKPTPKPTPETWAGLVKSAKKPNYRDFFRNNDQYGGELVYFEGTVFQVVDKDILMAVGGDIGNLVHLTDAPAIHLLAGDRILVVGTANGWFDYTNLLGNHTQVPDIVVTKLRAP